MQTKKQALIVVDVQNDFCPGGTLAVDHGDEVVAPLNKLIAIFLKRGAPVFKTRDWHPSTTRHFQKYGGTWPVHCVQNTNGAAFHPELHNVGQPSSIPRRPQRGRAKPSLLPSIRSYGIR